MGNFLNTFHGTPQQLVYVVQDVHCNPEAQKNIARILQIEEHGQQPIKTYVSETPTVLHNAYSCDERSDLILDLSLRRNTAFARDDREGQSTATDSVTADSSAPLIVGIEDKTEYMRNYAALYRSLSYRAQCDTVFKELEHMVQRGRTILFADVHDTAFTMERSYRDNTISLEQYAAYLLLKQIRHLIDAKTYRTLAQVKDSETLYRMLRVTTRSLHCAVPYPALQQYFQYYDAAAQIDPLQLVHEIDILTYDIQYAMLAHRHNAQQLLYSEKILGIFQRYIRNDASSGEVTEWVNNREPFFATISTLTALLSHTNIFATNEHILRNADATMAAFYRCAEKRNEVLVQNQLKINRNTSTSTALACLSDTLSNTNVGQGFSLAKKRACIPDIPSSTERGIASSLLNGCRDIHEKYSGAPRNDTVRGDATPTQCVSVMIVGGYHREGVAHYLRSKGISFVEVIPKVEAASRRFIYERGQRPRLQNNDSLATISQFMEGEITPELMRALYQAFREQGVSGDVVEAWFNSINDRFPVHPLYGPVLDTMMSAWRTPVVSLLPLPAYLQSLHGEDLVAVGRNLEVVRTYIRTFSTQQSVTRDECVRFFGSVEHMLARAQAVDGIVVADELRGNTRVVVKMKSDGLMYREIIDRSTDTVSDVQLIARPVMDPVHIQAWFTLFEAVQEATRTLTRNASHRVTRVTTYIIHSVLAHRADTHAQLADLSAIHVMTTAA